MLTLACEFSWHIYLNRLRNITDNDLDKKMLILVIFVYVRIESDKGPSRCLRGDCKKTKKRKKLTQDSLSNYKINSIKFLSHSCQHEISI